MGSITLGQHGLLRKIKFNQTAETIKTVHNSTNCKIFQWTISSVILHVISVDLFFFGDDYKDIALWSIISNNTGGTINTFPYLSDSIAASKFESTLIHQSRRYAALEAVLKVRSSKGVRIVEYFGNGLKRTKGGELDMAFIDQDNTSLVLLNHDGNDLSGGGESEVYLQCAQDKV